MFVVELSVLRWFFCEVPLGNSEGPNYSYEHQLAAPFANSITPVPSYASIQMRFWRKFE